MWSMRSRYVDAYRVARALDRIGATIKIIGYVLGAVVTLGSLLGFLSDSTSRNPFIGQSFMGAGLLVTGLVFAGSVAAVGFVLGTIVSAQGQILMATLDNAVNSSHFLTDEERAAIFGIAAPKQAPGEGPPTEGNSFLKDFYAAGRSVPKEGRP